MQNQDNGIAFAQDGQDAEDANSEASHLHAHQQCNYGRGGCGKHGGRDGGHG